MKKVFIAMAAIAAMACSCSKDEVKSVEVPEQEAEVSISLRNEVATRATGSGHGVQADDNTINVLEIFVFNINEGSVDNGFLDGYKKLTGDELKNLNEIKIRISAGRKMIYAVANAQNTDWSEGVTRELFEAQIADLYKEDVKDFLMVASKEETIKSTTTVLMTLRRFVSRIQLKSVSVSFAGTPYEGRPLENVKAYLTNVQTRKRLIDGVGDNLKVVNSKKYVASDMQGIAMEGMLYDQLASSIAESTHNESHYFYCYENNRKQETETDRFTRLVIEGTLDGITYYYPIPIKELKRNSCYTIDVKIHRAGSLDPEVSLEMGTLDLCLEVEGWNTIPGSVVEF